MAFRETNFLVTLVFDENKDIRKQINTEYAFRNEIIKDLQHLVIGKEIKHFVVADDEVINEKLKEERKKGKWIKVTDTDFGVGYKCSECGRFILTESVDGRKLKDYPFCHCGADMKGGEQ